MKCKKAMDMIFYYSGEQMPMLAQLQLAIHLFFCQDCAKQSEVLEASNEILCNDFFPPSPNLENSIMSKISAEESNVINTQEIKTHGELSTRGWAIAGIIILVSLVSLFFGLEYNNLANSTGVSFLLPLGITIGVILTSYGAFFIGSNLKELSKRFGL